MLLNVTGNTWVASGSVTTSSGLNAVVASAGSIALGGTLGMIRITTASGAPTFDAGSLNIIYE